MNEKLSFQNIADALSQKAGVSKKVAETFSKAFFDTIVEALYMGEDSIKIKGLGTFKLVEVESRESVNVTNGERIVIPGYKKVSFAPEDSVVELLNKGVETEDVVPAVAASEPVVEEEVSSAAEVKEEVVNEPVAEIEETPVVEEESALAAEDVPAEEEEEMVVETGIVGQTVVGSIIVVVLAVILCGVLIRLVSVFFKRLQRKQKKLHLRFLENVIRVVIILVFVLFIFSGIDGISRIYRLVFGSTVVLTGVSLSEGKTGAVFQMESAGITNLIRAMQPKNFLDLIEKYKDIEVVYPVHPNPNVRKPVNELLAGKDRIHLIEPLEYAQFCTLMKKSYLILTDSGGVQEEAPSLGKPVLVLRDTTERPEAVEYGTVKLVGAYRERIVKSTSILLEDEKEYKKMSESINPYGDGLASKRIVDVLKSVEKV